MTDPLGDLVRATQAASEVLSLQLTALSKALGIVPVEPPAPRRAGWFPARPPRARRRDIR